jgi:hypothetical protein
LTRPVTAQTFGQPGRSGARYTSVAGPGDVIDSINVPSGFINLNSEGGKLYLAFADDKIKNRSSHEQSKGVLSELQR